MVKTKKVLSKVAVLFILFTIFLSAIACTQTVEFKINFIVDGEIYKTINTAGEEAISMPENPTKKGYIFDGWYWDEDVWSRPFTAEYLLTEKLTADMSVYAKWITEEEAKIGVVSFETNGGSQIADIRTEKIETAPVSDKKGYILEGWYTNASLNGEYKVSFPLTVVNDMCLYAKWTAERYQITYHTNGGTLPSDAIFDYTIETSLALPVPDNGNNIFAGWYDNADCEGNPVVSINKGEIGEKEFWAKWYLYTVSENADESLTITSYSGGESIITIPETINGKRVTAIGAFAFENCSILKSITIPSSITSIGSNAFDGCIWLERVTFGEKSQLESIGSSAFSSCRSLKAVYITDIVTWFNIAFCNIMSNPLIYAENLYLNGELVTDIVIPSNVTDIGDFTLSGCSMLKSINISDRVTKIGYQAFKGCRMLTSIIIPDNVASIGDDAFSECDSLTIYCEVASKPSGWNTNWNRNLNSNCPVVWDCYNSGVAEDGSIYYVDESGIRYALKDGTATIARQSKALSGDIEIPSSIIYNGIVYSVTSIGDKAFYNFSMLKSITIPDGVTNIGADAFSYCILLESATFGENSSLESIGSHAFNGCSSLTSITIPDSVINIGSYAFGVCSSLTIYCEALSKLSGWDSSWNYSDCPVVWDSNNSEVADDGYIYYVDEIGMRYALKDGNAIVARQAHNLSGYIEILSSVIYKDKIYSVTSIDSYAFNYCIFLTSIIIPDSVISIDSYAFRLCSSFTSVFYKGSEQQWTQIEIDDLNSELLNVKIYCYSESEPTLNEDDTAYDGNYWRYVDGVPTPWVKEA